MLDVVHVVVTENFAGVERHVAVLANEQAERGLGVTVLGGHPAHMSKQLRRDVDFQPVRNVSSAMAGLRRRRADIFHAHMTAAEGACVAASVGTSVPIVTTRHFAAPRSRRAGPVARALIGRSMRAQIAVSDFVARNVDGPCEVVYAGVEEQPLVLHANRDKSVLMAQRLDPEKDSPVGIAAFAASGLAKRGWRLLVAGSGRERDAMESQAREAGLAESVRFLGFRGDVLTLMTRCSVFMATASAEPFGLSVAEAMASGKPVVAAGGGGHLESVGRAAPELLFSPGDPSAAAAKLAELAEDSTLRDVCGRALRATQQSLFTPARQHELTMTVYGSVLP